MKEEPEGKEVEKRLKEELVTRQKEGRRFVSGGEGAGAASIEGWQDGLLGAVEV